MDLEGFEAAAGKRVADGVNSTLEAARHAVAYGSGYRDGSGDASCGQEYPRHTDMPAYMDGYRRGYRWTVDHPRSNAAVSALGY